jgi:hypothetical protein
VVGGSARHTNKEAVLVLDQENQNILRESVFLGSHVVLWVRKQTRLEDGSQVRRGHLVQIRLARKNCQQIQNVQQQLTVKWRKFCNETLEDSNSSFLVEITNSWALCVHCANSLGLVVLQGIAEAFVEFQGNDRLGKLIEVPS